MQLIEKAQKRKNDTRKKILAGAYILARHEKNGTTKIFLSEMDSFLTRREDRELFGLLIYNAQENRSHK